VADIWVPALAGFAAALVPAILLYVSTRRRDAPTIEVAKEQARVAGAQAVSEAWAEYSARMEARLERAEQRLDECEAREDRLKKALNGFRR